MVRAQHSRGVGNRQLDKEASVTPRLLACIVAVVWVAHTAPARAGIIDFTLATPAAVGIPGSVLPFTGTLFNPGATVVFLNGTLSDIPPLGLTVDDQPFFANTPLSLAPGESFTGELFDVIIGAGVSPGTYNGSFTIAGGADSNAFDDLGTAPFSVTIGGVQVLAEPNAVLLFATLFAMSVIPLGRMGTVRRSTM
jgi:hypothetical protein